MQKLIEKILPWWPVIKFALLLGALVAAYFYGRSAGYEARINEENRDKIAAEVASKKFAELWNDKEAKRANDRTQERFDYDVISKEITNDFYKALRRQPFDITCTWPPELLDLRNQAIQRANQAASGVPGTPDDVPTTANK